MSQKPKPPDQTHQHGSGAGSGIGDKDLETVRTRLLEDVQRGERSLAEEGGVSEEDYRRRIDRLFNWFRDELAAGRMKP